MSFTRLNILAIIVSDEKTLFTDKINFQKKSKENAVMNYRLLLSQLCLNDEATNHNIQLFIRLFDAKNKAS